MLSNKHPQKGQYFKIGIYASRNVCAKDIGSWVSMVLQNYQHFIEMTSNMIYFAAFGGGLKYLRKIHLNTQCPPPICTLFPTAL